jgi:hypothetical protein
MLSIEEKTQLKIRAWSHCGLIQQLHAITQILIEEKKKLKEEIDKAEIKTESKGKTVIIETPIINPSYETSVKASVIFFQFAVLEATVNFTSDFLIHIHSIPDLKNITALDPHEREFILEKKFFFDPKKKVVKETSSFKRLEEKIEAIPHLFAKSFGQDFNLDKGDGHWEKFIKIKQLRDELTHPKSGVKNIGDKEIFDGATLIFWLNDLYFNLIQDLTHPDYHEPYRAVINGTARLLYLTNHATDLQFKNELKRYDKIHKEFRKKIE